MCVHERPADRIVSGRIRERGCWECSLRDLILQTLSVHANATFVDIGANIGAHTIAMAASGAAQHVYAFEAAPQNLLLLDESVRLNSLESRITIYAAALGAQTGFVRLGHTLHANQGGLHHTERPGGVQIPRVALDSALWPIARPTFVKVDIEGSECAALRGARTFLRDSNIVGVSIEIAQSRACCAEWCGREGLFGHLGRRGLCPFATTERPPRLDRLDAARCADWCASARAPAVHDVAFVGCDAAA